MKDYLIGTIQRTFEVGLEQAECLYSELLQCTSKKNLITVFRITDRPDWKSQELDQTILTALFTSQHLTPTEQLSLALTWNRVDIARSEIFVYGQEWPQGALDEAMMQALEHDRTDFVKLLLENGVSMRKFLTMARLEELYNTKQGPANTLTYILRDVRPHIPRGYVYTLHDIGLVINKLMGGAYRQVIAPYTRRKFRVIYAKVMKKSPHVHRNSASFIRYYGNTNLTMSLLAETMPTTKDASLFEFPFNELLIWSVLTKRQAMALLMWQHGEEALAKALVACKLYKAMAQEAAEDDLETEIYEELRSYSKEFETIALELLDYCYRQDDDQARQLLTCELQNWSAQTCLSLAVAANHRALLAHACSQTILADLWMGGLRTRKNTNLKVVLGLLCPLYVTRLDFKTKEELLLMPQTHEEHLFELEENESAETGTGDGPRGSDPDAEALIGEGGPRKETVVQENGSVLVEGESYNQLFPLYDIKAHRPLRLRKKFYEFFTAPITKFWAHSMAYVLFLIMFTYVVLVKMGPVPSWQELYIIAYICTLACEKVREIVSSEPVAVSHKFAVWAWNMWNPCDAAAIIFFLIGLSLRVRDSSMKIGRIIFCVDIIYWYLRILNILGVNKYLGPLVTMMGKMVKNMIYFVVLLLVVLMSFGVCRQAILYPDSDASWMLVREIFFQPYFMLYGEVFATDIDPACGEGPDQARCQMGRWITPVVMSMYLLVANILLINLLIAVFNNIFNEVNAVSHQVWMFQRFTVVMEYEQKPVLPPPLIALCHAAILFKYCRRKAQGQGTNTETYDNALKLFLDADDMERLYDFEEECVEGYFREQSSKLAMSSEERIRCTCERVENMYQKVEDINQKENAQTTAIQSVEFRIRKLEELAAQTVSHLAVIHRFMATHSRDPLAAASASAVAELELRTAGAAGSGPGRGYRGRARAGGAGRRRGAGGGGPRPRLEGARLLRPLDRSMLVGDRARADRRHAPRVRVS
ncbi:Transient receptor potential cation channel, partial [Gryllus bimaculatus]